MKKSGVGGEAIDNQSVNQSIFTVAMDGLKCPLLSTVFSLYVFVSLLINRLTFCGVVQIYHVSPFVVAYHVYNRHGKRRFHVDLKVSLVIHNRC